MSNRITALFGLVACICVLSTAYYLEQQYMLASCPLCILQRVIFMAMAVVFAYGCIGKLAGGMRYVYSSSLIIFSTLGMAIAGRQLWLQYFAPPQKLSCSASIQRLMELYPIFDVLKIILTGSGECAAIDFTILGLSIAAWSFGLFTLISAAMIYVLYLQKKRRI